MTFWDNFARACVLQGLSPTAVCKNIGLSNATATHWRQGALPKADAISAVCDVLGCSADYLLGRSDNISVNAPGGSDLTQRERELLAAFRNLPDRDKDKLIGQVEYMARQEREAQKKEA